MAGYSLSKTDVLVIGEKDAEKDAIFIFRPTWIKLSDNDRIDMLSNSVVSAHKVQGSNFCVWHPKYSK